MRWATRMGIAAPAKVKCDNCDKEITSQEAATAERTWKEGYAVVPICNDCVKKHALT